LLVRTLPKHVLLLNCPTGIKNMADSAGLREQVLEPSTSQNPCCFFKPVNDPIGGAA
jgi:hypothetical protein